MPEQVSRDPRVDPQPGDLFSRGAVTIMVTHATADTVYFGPYDAERQSAPLVGGHRMGMDLFREQAKEAEKVEAIDE